MKLLFRATADMSSYLAEDVRAYNGNVVQVSQSRGWKLLKTYPNNFFSILIPVSKLGEVVHKPITLSQITVLTINAYPEILKKCLLPSLPKEVEFIKLDNIDNKNWSSAAKALNYGIKKAKNNIVICAHVDLLLGKNWFQDFINQECRLKNWGCLGIVGVRINPQGERELIWGSNYTCPYPVDALDECCLVVNKKNNLWFDEKMLGDTWHCYGIDFCYQCHSKGLGVYILAGKSDHVKGGTSTRRVRAWMDDQRNILSRLEKKWKDKFSIMHHTSKMSIGILGVTLGLIHGGIRRRIELARRLEHRGYDVTLYVTDLNFHPGWTGLKLPFKIKRYPSKPIRADFIFYGGDGCGRKSFDEAQGKKIFMLQLRFSGIEPYLKDPKVIKLCFSNCWANILEKEFKCKTVRAIGGIDLDFFAPSNGQREKTILIQGGGERTKGSQLVKAAFDLIKGKYSDFKLSLLWDCKDQYEVRERYRKAFIFISGERLPVFCWNNPSAEAMACKCPVIVIDHRATRDHCLDKKTALIVDPNNGSIPNSMATMIEDLIRNNKLRNSLVENAYKHIQQFSWDRVVETIEREILKNG